jgi:hypothetical protein
VCQASTRCRTATCDAVKGVQLTPCSGICAPAERVMASAQLTSAATGATVQLNAPARSLDAPCSSLFQQDTSAALGSGATCSARDRSLSITFGVRPTVAAGAVLVLAPGQQQLVDLVVSGAAFVGNTTLDSCTACQRPTASLSGPPVSLAPQQGSAGPNHSTSCMWSQWTHMLHHLTECSQVSFAV